MLFAQIIFCFFLLGSVLHADAGLSVNPRSTSTTAGKNLYVECTVTSPDTFKHWTREDRVKITNNKAYQVSNQGGGRYRLTLVNITAEMAGLYYCESTRSSTPRQSVDLLVEATVSQCKLNQGVIANEVQMIDCQPGGGNPAPTITWKKRNSKGEFQAIKSGRFTTTKKGLQINKVKDEDSGVYEIVVVQGRREGSVQITVTVGYRPKINRELSRDEVYSYIGNPNDVTIRCEASGKPLPDVKIMRGNSQEFGEKLPVNKKGLNEIYITTKQKIDEFRFGSNYECQAKNEFGTDTMKISVIKASKPVLDVSTDLVGYIGGRTAITCPLKEGRPLPTYRWYRNGRELRNSSKYELRTGYKQDGALIIKDTQLSDRGEYVCDGRQILGNVKGRPYLRDVMEAGQTGARMSSSSVVGVVIGVVLIIILCIDLCCCFFNKKGITYTCYTCCCGKSEPEKKYATKEEAAKMEEKNGTGPEKV